MKSTEVTATSETGRVVAYPEKTLDQHPAVHRALFRGLRLAAVAALTLPIYAQFLQQGGKLTGSDASVPAYQGNAVAISSDGNTVVAGGYMDSANIGAAWVYTRSGGVWSQQGLKLAGSGRVGAGFQGVRVAISGDGNTVLVGGGGDNWGAGGNDNGVGAAWVYTRSGGVWTQQGGKLVGTGAIGNATQGFAVALSGDGNTALVGGYSDSNFLGAAWVWTRSGGVWTQQTKLVGSGWSGYSGQGFSVALSSDGNTALMGAWYDNNNAGAAWVFTRDSTGRWTQQGNKLVGSGATGAAQQGWSVALSSDGNTALVHGGADAGYLGAAWVFTRSSGVWTQQGGKLVGTGYSGQPYSLEQGHAAGLSADGNTAVLGRANDDGGAGAVWVFTRDATGAWSQRDSKLVGSGATGKAGQGYSAALSGDGGTVVFGGPFDNSKNGAAWAFAANPVWITSVNAAGAGTDIAQNGWIEIKGLGLAPSDTSNGFTWSTAPEFASGRMPTQIKGVSVKVNGKPAYVYYISPQQVNVLTPLDDTQGAVAVTVTNGSNTSASVSVNKRSATPAFLLFGSSRYIAATHADNSYLGPASMSVPGYTFTPAKPNETIVLYGAGFGPLATAPAEGSATQIGTLPTQPVIRIGGTAAFVNFAGVTSPGLYQFNVVVPGSAADGDNTVVAEYGAYQTPTALIPIQR
jgi:uncharacterized protein (TIGR03437 family)